MSDRVTGAIPVNTNLYREIALERSRQDQMFGVQDHPDAVLGGPVGKANWYQVPTAQMARQALAYAFSQGAVTWAGIFVEEVAEAIEATGDDQHLREELIQVAAVCVAWVEAIDRRTGEAV